MHKRLEKFIFYLNSEGKNYPQICLLYRDDHYATFHCIKHCRDYIFNGKNGFPCSNRDYCDLKYR